MVAYYILTGNYLMESVYYVLSLLCSYRGMWRNSGSMCTPQKNKTDVHVCQIILDKGIFVLISRIYRVAQYTIGIRPTGYTRKHKISMPGGTNLRWDRNNSQ
jgi:hypothetical protein